MRILHLIASNVVGGPEKQILHHAGDLRGSGYEIVVGSFRDAPDPPIVAAARRAGHETVCLRGGWTLRSVDELRRALASRKIDLLCTHGYKANIVGHLACRGGLVPQVGFARGWTAETWRIAWLEKLDRWVLARVDAVVCVSPRQAECLTSRRRHRGSPLVIRNASLPPMEGGESVSRESLGLDAETFVFGAAGRLSAEKGHRDLVQAFAALCRCPDAGKPVLLLLGDGREKAALRRQAAALGVADRVRFLGFQPACSAYMRCFDCLVQPSLTEGTPNAVLEALHLRLPVIATAVGGVPDLIHDGVNGMLAPPRAPSALAAAMERVLTDATLRARLRAAAALTGAEFLAETQRRRLIALYREMSNAASHAGERPPQAGATPLVSVVVPVRNEGRRLPALLDELLAQDYPAEKTEIVVVDGMSTDHTAAVARTYEKRSNGHVRLLLNPKLRASAGRNVGLRASRGEWVIFVDGHCHIPSPGMLTAIVAAGDRHGAQCIARPQPLTAPGASRFQRCLASVRATPIAHGLGSTIFADAQGHWVNPASSGAGYRRSVLSRVGEFDESFDACEDVEFNWRVHRAGVAAWLSRDFAVAYQARSNLAGLWRQMVRYGRGRVRLARKHGEATSATQWLPAAWSGAVGLGALAAALAPPLVPLFWGGLGLYGLVILGYSAGLARRHGFYALAVAPWIYLTVHAGLGAGAWMELICRARNGAEPHGAAGHSALKVAGHRVPAAGGEIAGGPRDAMPATFRPAARWRERELGRGGLVISPEMSAATERSAGVAGQEAVAVAPQACGAEEK